MYVIDEFFELEDGIIVSPALKRKHASKLTQSIIALDSHSSAEAAFIRLLMGTGNLRHKPTSSSVPQTLNHAVLGSPSASVKSANGLQQLMVQSDIDYKSLDRHLRLTLKQSSYYQQLILEAAHYLYRTHLGQHCLAFLHIYRILERISFAFPVIYAAESDNFIGAFQSLKDYIGGEKAGELKFFNKFAACAMDETLLESDSSISFMSLQGSNRIKAYQVVKRSLNHKDIVSDTPDSELVIKNLAIVSLLIEIRNRYFHSLSDHSGNLSLVEVPDPDGFFECVNSCFFEWLAVIYFEVLRCQLKRV